MFKITGKDLTGNVAKAVIKFGTVPVDLFDVPTIFILGKIKEEYMNAFKSYYATRDRYINHYCEKDKNGNPIILKQEGNNKVYKFSEESGNKFAEKMEELNKIEYTINAKKLSFKISEFPAGVFDGDDFMNLKNIIDFIDDTDLKDEK